MTNNREVGGVVVDEVAAFFELQRLGMSKERTGGSSLKISVPDKIEICDTLDLKLDL